MGFSERKMAAIIPNEKKPGWIIPKYLKENWELIIGKNQEKLPQLLNSLKKINFFIHNSEHTYNCMWVEYNEAFKALNHRGILMFHNIDWSNAFYEFCKINNKILNTIGQKTGYLLK